MQYRLLLSNYQSRGTVRASESGVCQHSFGANPITGQVDIFDSGLVHGRPSRQTSISCPNDRMSHCKVWKKSLVNDQLLPSRFNNVHKLFELSPIGILLPMVRVRQILGDVNESGFFRTKVSPP